MSDEDVARLKADRDELLAIVKEGEYLYSNYGLLAVAESERVTFFTKPPKPLTACPGEWANRCRAAIDARGIR